LSLRYGRMLTQSASIGFTVNERDELWAGVRIFEIASAIPTMRHFVYAGIDYYLQLTGFDPKYGAHHTK
jgi:hypothetical protein